MARSMIAVLVCTLLVSSLLVTRAEDDSLAALQQQSLGEYQQEEAQEIQFNMQMQKLQAEGKMADKASGAQVGGGRRLVQDLEYVTAVQVSTGSVWGGTIPLCNVCDVL